jgi:hypothetical protein
MLQWKARFAVLLTLLALIAATGGNFASAFVDNLGW